MTYNVFPRLCTFGRYSRGLGMKSVGVFPEPEKIYNLNVIRFNNRVSINGGVYQNGSGIKINAIFLDNLLEIRATSSFLVLFEIAYAFLEGALKLGIIDINRNKFDAEDNAKDSADNYGPAENFLSHFNYPLFGLSPCGDSFYRLHLILIIIIFFKFPANDV